MHDLEIKILHELSETGIIKKGDHLLVGVSGGADSMGLLHLLNALKEQLGLTLTAAYVDHGLRPGETSGEKTLVEAAAKELGAGFCAGTVKVRDMAREQGLSTEEAARDLRYGFLGEAAEKYTCTRIAVAHTGDDQAEELLLRLVRGTGRSGLSGMDHLNFRNVVRPFLNTAKKEILGYIWDRNITYLEDSSNTDRTFLRNRVRLELLPYLAENFNPAIRRALLRTADILRAENEVLDRLAAEVSGRAVTFGARPDSYVIDCPALAAEALALQRRVVENILADLSSTVSFQQIEKVLELVADGREGAELHLPEGLRVVRKDQAVLLAYPAGRTRQRGSLQEGTADFLVEIDGPGNYPVSELSAELVVSVADSLPDQGTLSAGTADYLDMSSFDFPLQVRSLQSGDRFRPLGGPGSRKVADFLSDRKIPRDERRRVPILVKNTDVLALLGLRIDDRYKLDQTTSKVLKVVIKPFT